MSTKKRWIAYRSTYEPNFKHPQWGDGCIYYTFTNREKTNGDKEIHPSIAYHTAAIERVEKGGEELHPLFTNDISYFEVLAMLT